MVFITVSGTELLKSLEFPKGESYKVVFCYVNEMTFGKYPRMGVEGDRLLKEPNL